MKTSACRSRKKQVSRADLHAAVTTCGLAVADNPERRLCDREGGAEPAVEDENSFQKVGKFQLPAMLCRFESQLQALNAGVRCV